MKSLLLTLAFICSFFAFGQEDKIILTINGEEVRTSEFMYIYTKNNPNPSYDADSLNDYMELFINYKLKVHEARRLKYDTIPRLVKELADYREQLSLPYMVDQEMNEELIKQAYHRTINEVKASHILVNVPQNATDRDTANAYKKIMDIRKEVMDGLEFSEAAKKYSDDPSAASNGGNLGYFTAFQMVYPFEEAAFNTKEDKVSMPIRTRFGYHIIWVDKFRQALGKVQSAHIMIISNSKMSQEDQDKAKKKVDEIYAELQGGAVFEDLAKKYSEDNSSRNKGGLLPKFGAGTKQRMVPEFEDAVFELKNDGDYSAPVKTSYGWHIIKRVSLEPVPTYEEMYRELKLKVERDVRAKTTQQSFVNKLKKEYRFHEHKNVLKLVVEQVDESIYNAKWKGVSGADTLSKHIMSFAGKEFTIAEFSEYMKKNQTRNPQKIDLGLYVDGQYEAWVTEEIKKYEDTQLESKYPAFKSLIQEYRDGILVFEIMQNEIWNKASKDSTGIENYFNNHRDDFTYPTRFDGVMYRCKSKETVKDVLALIKTDTLKYGEIQKMVNKDSELNCFAKKHIFNSETTEAFKIYKKGNYKGLRKLKTGVNKAFEHEGEYYIMDIKEILAPRKREFSEARGLVTAAYQNQMEEEWLKKLRTEYDIQIKTDVLHGLKPE